MGGKTLTRADLAEAVVRKVGLPRNESQELVELVLGGKGKRIGRNPKTGEEVPITPRRVLVFRASNIMKDRINAGLSKRRAAE